MVKEIIQDVPDTRFDRAHFLAFDESQLTFEVVYFVLSAEYNKYMDIQQEINLQLMAQLEQKQIRFAFPMRRVEFTGGVLPRINLSDASNESSPQTAQR